MGAVPSAPPRGFTLVELVMVIALTGVIAVVASRFIAAPLGAYLDVGRRAALVDRAELALTRLGREIRLAVPNSVRVTTVGDGFELLRMRTAGRYRAVGVDHLDFSASTDTFDVIGTLRDAGAVTASATAVQADCLAGTVDCLVVYNTGQPGADAYAGDNVAAITAAAAGSLAFTAPAPFPYASPSQRFYVADGPVTYLCDGASGELRRYSGYPVTADNVDVDSHAELVAAGASVHLLADGVAACSFALQPGTATRAGLVTLSLAVSEAGERVSLLQQVHVSNLP